jgi:hypothetical protein
VGGDGEWKVVIFYMFGEEKWQNWIVNIGLAPFFGDEAAAGKTVDIAFMKFYLQDPYDLYKELEYDPDKVVEDTAAPETEVPTEQPTEEATKAPETQAPAEDVTPAPETEAPAKEGCGSTLAVGMIAVLALGAVLTLKKKED